MLKKRKIEKIATFILVALLMNSLFGYRRVNVSGPSMEPTLHDKDKGYVARWKKFYVQRGDIVLAKSKDVNNNSLMVIKRVIATPGDTIEILDGEVIVNGILINEDYSIKETIELTNLEEITLGEGQYWIMGDNRNNSTDSRRYGPIDRKAIYGVFSN